MVKEHYTGYSCGGILLQTDPTRDLVQKFIEPIDHSPQSRLPQDHHATKFSVAACSRLSARPSSKTAVKARISCEQVARVSWQATQHTIYSKEIENTKSSIKFQ